MTDHSVLIERLRKAAQHAGLLLVDPPKPSPAMALLDQAASALSSLIEENAALSSGVQSEIAGRSQLSLSEARALAEVQQNGNRFASSQWTKCELRLKEAEEDRARLLKQRQDRAAERDALVAAGEELVTALGRYGFPMSDEAWRNTGDDAPVNSQASVEARALHRAAAAYLRAISGGFDGGK